MHYLRHLFISLIFFCFIGCTFSPNQLNKAEQLMETAPDSALEILKQIKPQQLFTPSNKALYALLMSQALDKNDIKLESDSLIHIATDYYTSDEAQRAAYAWFYSARVANNKGEAKTQADALLKAQEYADKTDNYKLKGLVYYDKGNMYFAQKQYSSSIHYFKNAHLNFKFINDNKNVILSLLNIGYGYLYMNNNDSATYYYKLAEKKAIYVNDTTLLSVTLRNLGTLYLQQKMFTQSLFYYKSVPIAKLNIFNSNKWYLIANVYLKMNNLDSARLYLKKVKELDEMAPKYYGLWQQVYQQEGNFKQALVYATKATYATDSLYKTKLDVSFAGLEKKYKYQGLELEKKQLTIKTKQYGIVILIVLLILSIFMLIVLFWRIRVKKQQLETQNQLLMQEQALVEKVKENNALLSKQMKLQSILLLNIEQHRKNSIQRPEIWKNVSKEVNPLHNSLFYQEIIACTDLEFNNISERLSHKYEKLTQRDIIMCCLLLANFESGMIATILDVQIDSIIKHRHRLRTKLILPKSDNLLDFLQQF